MGALSTAIPRDERQAVFINAESGLAIEKMRLDFPRPATRSKPVTEAEYWENYYDDPDIIYEWNNSILEEVGVSDLETTLMFEWLFDLVGYYLDTHPIGKRIFLETGFSLPLPHKTAIRRPDLGVILYQDAVPYKPHDNSYKGICNLCVEAISDSKKKYITQDTKVKFSEYEIGGVQEYFILYSKDIHLEFYCLDKHGLYVPIKRVQGDVIQSQVLPGFQFRISDLDAKPSPRKMAFDPVYEKFVMPYYQAEKKAHQAEKKAHQAEKKAHQAEKKARLAAEEKHQAEKKARLAAEEKTKRLEAELARVKK